MYVIRNHLCNCFEICKSVALSTATGGYGGWCVFPCFVTPLLTRWGLFVSMCREVYLVPVSETLNPVASTAARRGTWASTAERSVKRANDGSISLSLVPPLPAILQTVQITSWVSITDPPIWWRLLHLKIQTRRHRDTDHARRDQLPMVVSVGGSAVSDERSAPANAYDGMVVSVGGSAVSDERLAPRKAWASMVVSVGGSV